MLKPIFDGLGLGLKGSDLGLGLGLEGSGLVNIPVINSLKTEFLLIGLKQQLLRINRCHSARNLGTVVQYRPNNHNIPFRLVVYKKSVLECYNTTYCTAILKKNLP